jgi:hypothetical protein
VAFATICGHKALRWLYAAIKLYAYSQRAAPRGLLLYGAAVCETQTMAQLHQLVAQLRGAAAEREAAYATLLQLEAEHFSANGGSSGSVTETAVACASPLCEVLCQPVSEVSAAEWRRAAQVLTALSGLDPARVGGECWNPRQCNLAQVWMAPDNALGVVLAKEPASLSAEDALTAGWAYAPEPVQWATSTSYVANTQAAGIDSTEFFTMYMPANFMLNVPTPSDDRNLVLCPLLLQLLAAPEKLPDFALGGVLMALQQGVISRPAVTAKLLKQDIVAVLVALLRQVSPTELIANAGFSRRPHGFALGAFKDLVETVQAGGEDISAQLLTGGFVDTLLSALSAVEEVGADNANAYVVVWGCLMALAALGGEALPQIEDKLRAIPSTLRYLKESQINFWSDFGITAGTFASIVAGECLARCAFCFAVCGVAGPGT